MFLNGEQQRQMFQCIAVYLYEQEEIKFVAKVARERKFRFEENTPKNRQLWT